MNDLEIGNWTYLSSQFFCGGCFLFCFYFCFCSITLGQLLTLSEVSFLICEMGSQCTFHQITQEK